MGTSENHEPAQPQFIDLHQTRSNQKKYRMDLMEQQTQKKAVDIYPSNEKNDYFHSSKPLNFEEQKRAKQEKYRMELMEQQKQQNPINIYQQQSPLKQPVFDNYDDLKNLEVL